MPPTAKKALITGARRNIGRGIALALANDGCDIGINDLVRDDETEETLDLIAQTGRKVEFFQADLAETDQIESMMEAFLGHFGRIDILVNNAYYAEHMHFLELTEDNWDRTFDVCLKSYFLCSQAAARAMVMQGDGGAIVHISSVHAQRVWPDDTGYGVAKAAIDRLAKSMAVDLGKYGIRANSVIPGYVQTGHPFGAEPPPLGALPDNYRAAIPADRRATPEDIGRAVAFLCSSKAGNVTGVNLPVDGGFLVAGTP
jgi:NAD(P)-dependent dehydrogenase (short-subunit alcohol dehydrogenase family)